MKQRLIAVVGIVAAWFVLDIAFHGMWLMGEYEATAHLWRPEEEMNRNFMLLMNALKAFVFVFIYCNLIRNKSVETGVKFGALTGVLLGLAAAASYCYMPITQTIALGWFLANLVGYTVAGAIAGKLVTCEMKDCK